MSARGINKVILVGRLAMIRKSVTSPTGAQWQTCRCYVRKLARQTDGGDAGADGMDRVVLFGKLAEVAGEYLRKGRRSTSRGNSVPVAGKITVSPLRH